MLIPGETNCGVGNRKTNPKRPPVAKIPYHAMSTSVSSRTSPEEARAKRGLLGLGLSGLPAATSTDI
jgi:hypothetical protein